MTDVPAESAPLRIAIADDHAIVRRGIRTFFDTEPDLDVVGEAENSIEMIALCARLQPDVALVDLMMPGGGLAAIRGVHEVSKDTRIIVLTSFEDPAQALPAIEAGAVSYLLKDVAPEELAEAVRRAASGEASLHPRVAAHVVAALHERAPASGQDGPLSQREREVLLLIAEGLSNQQIAERLGIGEKTVKSHVGSILLKLDLQDRTQAAVYAWRRGWIG